MSESSVSESQHLQHGGAMIEVLNRASEFSSLPDLLAKTMAIVEREDATIEELTEVLEQDPAIASTLLREVNSAAMGMPKEITSLAKAVSLLGFKHVRNVVVASTVCELFKDDTPIGPYTRSRLWRHMLAVAMTARLIARKHKICDPESAYLAGLLHDIGIAVEDQYDHERFRAMMEQYTNPRPLPDMEYAALGYDHTQLGRALAERWGMPDFVLVAIDHHHRRESIESPHAKLLACVQLANTMVSMQGTPSADVEIPKALKNVVEQLSLKRQSVLELIDDMMAEFEQHPMLGDAGEPKARQTAPPTAQPPEDDAEAQATSSEADDEAEQADDEDPEAESPKPSADAPD